MAGLIVRWMRGGTAAGAIAAVSLWTALPTPAQSPPVVRPDLEVGVRDSSVAELQATLQLLGFYEDTVTGTYSAQTSEAVARFQQAAGLPNTGRVGRRTWDALFPPASGSTAGTITGATPGVTTGAPTGATNNGQASLPRPVTQPDTRPAPRPILSNEPAAPVRPVEAPAPATSPTPNTTRPAPAQPDPNDPFPILREGAEGDAVARLQRLLQQQGLFEGTIDGDFGPLTLEAVIAVQEQLGLEADGVVGPATWDALTR